VLLKYKSKKEKNLKKIIKVDKNQIVMINNKKRMLNLMIKTQKEVKIKGQQIRKEKEKEDQQKERVKLWRSKRMRRMKMKLNKEEVQEVILRRN